MLLIDWLTRELGDTEYEDWVELHKRAELALEKRDKLLMESYNRHKLAISYIFMVN